MLVYNGGLASSTNLGKGATATHHGFEEMLGLDMVDFDQESNKMFNEVGNNFQLEQHADFRMVLHSCWRCGRPLISIEYTDHHYKGHLYHVICIMSVMEHILNMR